MYEVKVNEHNVCNKESVFTVDVKEKEVKESDVTIFDLKIFSRLFIYAIIIGFFYNLTYYNYGLKIDIFNYLEVNDIIFSWISDSKIITMIIILFSLYILFYKRLQYNKEESVAFLVITILLLILSFIFEEKLITLTGLKNIYSIWICLIYSIFIFLLSLLNIYQFKLKIVEDFKNPINLIKIELLMLFGAILLCIIYAGFNLKQTQEYPQSCQIIFIKDTNLKSSNEEYHFIGRTSNVTIFKDSQEKINVINNSDISNIIFDKK